MPRVHGLANGRDSPALSETPLLDAGWHPQNRVCRKNWLSDQNPNRGRAPCVHGLANSQGSPALAETLSPSADSTLELGFAGKIS